MNKVRYILLLISINLFTSIKAQFDSSISNFSDLSYLYNPSTTGVDDNVIINIFDRKQWSDVQDAPSTMIIHVSYPLQIGNKVHGLGLTISKESIGLFSTQNLLGQYSYSIKFPKSTLRLGIQAGIIQNNFDANDIYIPNSDYHISEDLSIPYGELNANTIDFATGISYEEKNFSLGLSSTHLTKTKFNLKDQESSEETTNNSAKTYAERTYYFLGKYNIILRNPLYRLRPSVLVKTTFNTTQYDINAKLVYDEKISGGLGWRSKNTAIFYFGVKLPIGIKLNYSYDLNNDINSVGGCNEIYLTYSKKINKSKTRKSKKSVRFL